MTDAASAPSGLEAIRLSLIPMLRVQQESLSAVDRLAQYHYALAGDYWAWTVAQTSAALTAKSPTDLLTRQADLSVEFTRRQVKRASELTGIVVTAAAAIAAPTAVSAVASIVPPAVKTAPIPAANVAATTAPAAAAATPAAATPTVSTAKPTRAATPLSALAPIPTAAPRAAALPATNGAGNSKGRPVTPLRAPQSKPRGK